MKGRIQRSGLARKGMKEADVVQKGRKRNGLGWRGDCLGWDEKG